ncbi:MAG: CoA transferase [Alphaproteobacteria bacterium]|nr:MAG: CoA transferase [Alphaproteobacteria bacterium]
MSALSHLRVLDLTRVRAGPACTRILCDFGAEVIRIEAPAGADPNEGVNGPRDGSDMQNLHRGKRSVTLNLKLAEGRALFLRLCARADAVVENFRPGVIDRLGIGWPVLQGVNPRLILASISGFGQTGPRAGQPGFDQLAQGMGGLMAVTGPPGQGPVRAGAAVADIGAGWQACIGILVALAERERSGLGQWVQTSLLQAQIAMMDFQAARYLVDGEIPGQAGNEHPVVVPTGVVETADGHINLGVAGDGQWRALCAVLGLAELARDSRFATVAARTANRAACWAAIRPAFRSRTSAAWLAALAEASVPAGPIHRMDAVFADPQVRHLGMAVPVTHPGRGEIRLVGPALAMSRTPPAIRGPAPAAGADTEAVLGALGLSGEAIAALRRAGVV